MTRKSFIWYKSFSDAGDQLMKKDKLAFYDRITRYALDDDDTPSESMKAETLFILVKPILEQNILRAEGGKKGGRPRKPIPKENETKANVEAIPLEDGTEWKPTVSQYNEFCKAYSNLDIPNEFRKMRAWSLSNPSHKKTRRGVTRFVNGWLNRAVDNRNHNQNIKSLRLPEYLEEQKEEHPATEETIKRIREMQQSMNDEQKKYS